MAKNSFETVLYSARDEHGLIEVVENSISRSLYFGSPVEQSRYYLNAPMTLALEYQETLFHELSRFTEKKAPSSVLMLGLGGGSLASHFHTLHPKCQQTVVELRQEVIDIAYDYFNLPNVPEINIIQADALTFVMQCQQQFDIIIVDLFDHKCMPIQFCEPAFLSAIKHLKKVPGLVLFNLWSTTPKRTSDIIQYWLDDDELTLKTYEIKSSGNIIVSLSR